MSEIKGTDLQGSVVFEPEVGQCYGNGWRQLWKYFLELLLINIVGYVIALPSGLARVSGVFTPFVIVYNILVGGPVGYGVSFAHLKAARGEKVEVKDIFAAFGNYWNAVLAGLLVAVIVGIGFVLLIIPGIIFGCKLAFTPYLVVDRKMEVIEAVKESWRMTEGHALTIFLIGLLAIPISIAGLICLGVGIIPAAMWIRLTAASLYYSVSAGMEGAQEA